MTFEHQRGRVRRATEHEREREEQVQELQPGVATAGQEARPWIVVGLVFLALFVAIVVWVVIRPVA